MITMTYRKNDHLLRGCCSTPWQPVPIRPTSGSQFVLNSKQHAQRAIWRSQFVPGLLGKGPNSSHIRVLVCWLPKREIFWIRHWFSYLKLCENVRNMSFFAKICGKHDIMRNCAEIAKLCEIVRWTSNCAIPHSPHWNGGYGTLWWTIPLWF